VIVGGIVGVVTVTDLGARADNSGSRVSVAKIDIAAPAHRTPPVVTTTDSDIPVPVSPGTVTVPAPDPGKVVTTEAKAHKSTVATSDAASKQPAKAQQPSGRNSSGQASSGQNRNQDAQGGQHGNGDSGATGQSHLNSPIQPKLQQRVGIIAQAPVHGHGPRPR
jgi:hypothetical protein